MVGGFNSDCKTNLNKKILGRASFDYEELVIAMRDCKRTVNSRPLTYMSEDIDNDIPIIPEQFLYETPQLGVPDVHNVDKLKLSNRIKSEENKRSITSLLPFRASSIYYSSLIKCYKKKSLKVGEIVLF